MEFLPAKAQPLHHASAHILDDDICLFDQVPEDCRTFIVLEVDCYADFPVLYDMNR